jgi:hypothetical protein
MKITKSQLKQIIKEVVGGENEEQPGEDVVPAGPGAGDLDSSGQGKEKSDVKTALQYIQKVNNRGEYAQMLMAIVQHGQSIPGAKSVLIKLYRQLPGMAKQMQESKLNEDEGLPKRKPEHVDYDKGHKDGFEGKPKKKDRSKDYNEGFKDGRASDKEYKDVTKESKLNEDDVQTADGGNWSQPGIAAPESEGGAELPPEQVQEIALQVVELLSTVGHNDVVDILNFVAEQTGVVEMPAGPDVAIAEARALLKEGLIRHNFKSVLEKALK